MMAASGKMLSEHLDDLFKKYGKRVEEQRTIPLTLDRERILRKLRKHPPSHLDGRKVSNVEIIEGLKLDFSNDDWILLRSSGTEPVIRCYAEAGTQKDVKRLLRSGLEKLS